LVRTEGARLGLAHAAASESHATPALADERLIVKRRWSQDHASQGDDEQDNGEALDDPAEGHREAHHCKALHGQAQHRQARHGEANDGQAWRPQDYGSPEDHRALDREAHDAPQLRDTQEAPLIQAGD